MRKHSRRRVRPCSAPMLVNRGLQSESVEMLERQIVEAFSGGWADAYHFDSLIDMRNMLTLAAAQKDQPDTSAETICEAMRVPLANIRARKEATGKFGVSAIDLQLIRAFVGFYSDFWLRKSVGLFCRLCDELDAVKTATNNVGLPS